MKKINDTTIEYTKVVPQKEEKVKITLDDLLAEKAQLQSVIDLHQGLLDAVDEKIAFATENGVLTEKQRIAKDKK